MNYKDIRGVSNVFSRIFKLRPRTRGLYLIQFECGGIKVGVSKDLAERVQSYESPWVKPMVAAVAFRCGNPIRLEMKVKQRFKKHTRPGSNEFFFGLTLNQILDYLEKDYFFRK
jgi:hypothetical protein